MRRVVVGGVTSGVGKTMVTCALIAAFRRRGYRVQPFKAGPDYIDPSHHSLAAALPSRNLDTVLLPIETVRALFARAANRANVNVVEGVMGLFDGRNGRDDEGSTAYMAKILDAPVVVVMDVSHTSRTAGAIALGCRSFDQDLRIAGFILNRVGSDTHALWAREAVEDATGLPVFGAFPYVPEIELPERHLGLVPTAESGPDAAFFERLGALAESRLDLNRLWSAMEARLLPGDCAQVFPEEPVPPHVRLAIARDKAFNFYYEDSLELLRAWGAELLPFSPLEDTGLPAGSQGVYVGGGFPEQFAAALAENTTMHDALRRVARARVPVYGECGGLMYLGRTLADLDGARHSMVGIVPIDSKMQNKTITIGYRAAIALRTNPLLTLGEEVIGHEFHYSEPVHSVAENTAAYRLPGSPFGRPAAGNSRGEPEGYAVGNVLASYIHLHFGTNPTMARRFIACCSRGDAVLAERNAANEEPSGGKHPRGQ